MNVTMGRGAIALLLAVLGLIAYGNTLRGEWVWDDASSVLLHKHVQDPSKVFQLFKEDQHAFGRGEGNFYRPMVSVSFMIDYLLSYNPTKDAAPDLAYPGVKPLLFHLSNIGWHVAAAFFLCLLLERLGAALWVRLAVAVLFLVHPLHTEAVAYISGRADMMSGAFMMAGLWLALSPAQGRAQALRLAAAVACFLLGLLSKESSFIFPVLLLLILLLQAGGEGERRPFLERRGAFALIGSLVVLVGYGFCRMTILNFKKGGDAGSTVTPFAERAVETVQAFAWYLQLLFWPTGLHMERTLDGATALTAVCGVLGLVAILGAAVVAWRAGHRRVTLGFAWFVITWLPISGLFPLNAPMAEHWLYVPMMGFWWAVLELAALALAAPAARTAATVAVAALAVMFVHFTLARNEDWRSNEALFRATLSENPNTERVAFNLAVTYGDIDRNPAGARRLYEQILARYAADPLPNGALRPNEPEIRVSLATQLVRQGEYSEAIGCLTPLVPLSKDPAQAELVGQALFQIGQCSLALGDVVQADRAFRGASQLVPQLKPLAERVADGGPLMLP